MENGKEDIHILCHHEREKKGRLAAKSTSTSNRKRDDVRRLDGASPNVGLQRQRWHVWLWFTMELVSVYAFDSHVLDDVRLGTTSVRACIWLLFTAGFDLSPCD